jgi:hypothetical protein
MASSRRWVSLTCWLGGINPSMSLYLWRWLALLPTTINMRMRAPRWLIAGLALLLLAVGALALVVPTVGASLLALVAAACGVALALSGTLRGLYCAVDTALTIQRYASNTGWAVLQATPEGALNGVLEKLRSRLSAGGTAAIQRALWRLMIVTGGVAVLLLSGAQAALGQSEGIPWWVVALIVFIAVDSTQSIPLGALVGLISARASSGGVSAALSAGLLYAVAKGFIFALSGSFMPALGLGALLALFSLHEGLLWMVWRVLHGTYDADG